MQTIKYFLNKTRLNADKMENNVINVMNNVISNNIFKDITIGFWTPQLDVRGSCDALYNYADYYEKMYGGKSIIITPENNSCETEAFNKFVVRFSIFTYTTLENMEEVLENQKVKILYLIKYGKNDNIFSKKIPNIIHCVFDLSEPHGKVYIAVSKQLARKYNKEDYLPHMIGISKTNDENLRKELDIPENAVVIGRYGGMDTFDLLFVRIIIQIVVRERKDIYFLFANTPKFDEHAQIIYVDRFSDMEYKQKFINTCDAYIEGGNLGHSFGIAQGEFSVFNKALIIYDGPVWNRSHIEIAGESAIYYRNEKELYSILMNFKRGQIYPNCYEEFTPEKVMEKFKEIILLCLN